MTQEARATRRVAVPGGEVQLYEAGGGPEAILFVNGGPGLPCDYVRDSHARLAAAGYRCIFFDQLGTGLSDMPDDPALWTLARSVAELEGVRRALGLEYFHLFGQSWGTFLAIEYLLTHPGHAKTLILGNGAADIPHLESEMLRLRDALGPETVAMMQRHEAQGTFTHPEYQAAITLLYRRHICRCPVWPAALERSFAGLNAQVYAALWGANEYCITGSLKTWNRLADLGRIAIPSLVIVGQHDELTPDCARRMHAALPDSGIAVFENSSHTPFFEEEEAYFARLEGFLGTHRGASAQRAGGRR